MRDLSRERALTPDDLNAFYAELIHGSDQACALIGCAFVDNTLRDLLLTHMRGDWPEIQDAIFDGLTAPLPNLHSRITVAYALEAIDAEVKAKLDAIRRIRNAFAHSEKPLTFSHPLIEKECRSLDRHPVSTSPVHPLRVAYVRSCLSLAIDLGKEFAQRMERNALVRALAAYKPPTSAQKPLSHISEGDQTTDSIS